MMDWSLLPGLVLGPGGILYGTTYSGGPGGWGTVYSLTPPTAVGAPWIKTILYGFTGGSDGGNPSGVVIGRSASDRLLLFGTTDKQAIDGGRFFRASQARIVRRRAPCSFSAMPSSHCASVILNKSICGTAPAMFSRASILPKRSSVPWTRVATDRGSRKSSA